jgi:uncharacterized protein (TIGR02246 family)
MLKLIAAAVLALNVGAMRAQKPDQLFTATKQQLDVTKVVLAQEAAWNKGDLEGYLASFKDADDTVAMLAAPTRGMNNIRAAYRLNYPNAPSMGTLEESDVEVRALGEGFAMATGKYHLARSRKAGGDVDGTFTEVMEKTTAGWRVIFIETT